MRDEHREIPPDGRWQAGRKMRAYKHKQEISSEQTTVYPLPSCVLRIDVDDGEQPLRAVVGVRAK
jgi:hypothetical protein